MSKNFSFKVWETENLKPALGRMSVNTKCIKAHIWYEHLQMIDASSTHEASTNQALED